MDFEKLKELLQDCFDCSRDKLPFDDEYTFETFESWFNSRKEEVDELMSVGNK